MTMKGKTSEEPEYAPVDPDVSQNDKELFIFDESEVIESEKQQAQFPEALCSATVTLWTPKGGNILFTVRGTHPETVLDRLANSLMYGEDHYGLTLSTDYRGNKSQQGSQQNQEQPSGQGEVKYNGNPVLDSGVSSVSQIVVTKDHVEFSVGKFTYPFKDSRSPDVINALFDADLGFEVVHFEKPTVYVERDWGEPIVAEWVKVKKGDKTYYNITRIRKV